MSLTPGTRLGPYEIVSPLGAGGMGEVYRARDTRLGRTVAIKIIRSDLAADADLRQRFEREARAVSSLNHPHICALFDIGHEEGLDYLVMEHLEGETLSHRLASSPLPTDEALLHAIQIAEALDAAHAQGVVHRDLKPGNVMLTRSGAKLLDFGLARLQVERPQDASSDLSSAPTRAVAGPHTAKEVILGTVQYMAPEQIERKAIDARTDIFALGQVIYEMATGQKAFEGSTSAAVAAAILKSEPPAVSQVRPDVPSALDHLVSRCLAKNPESRWRSAHDIALELRWIQESMHLPETGTAQEARAFHRGRLGWIAAAAAAAVALALGLLLMLSPRASSPQGVIRFSLDLPQGTTIDEPYWSHPCISPDGRTLAFIASSGGEGGLWIRPLDALSARLLPGTEGALAPFWSPEGQSIAFFAQSKLKTVAAAGGPPHSICDVPSVSATGTWGSGGTIVFRIGEAPGRNGLYRVSALGGTPLRLRLRDASGEEFAEAEFPHLLPDGNRFFFIGMTAKGEWGGYLASLDTETVELVTSESRIASRVEYAPPGYVLGVDAENTLIAQRFDARRGRSEGSPVPVAENVGAFAGGARFSVSNNGVLVYGRGWDVESRLTWFDRAGHTLGSVGAVGIHGAVNLSPDERRLAVEIEDARAGTSDIWVFKFPEGTPMRLTSEALNVAFGPIWSPDGREIAYTQPRDAPPNLFRMRLGHPDAELLVPSNGHAQWASDWSPDGRSILYMDRDPNTDVDLWSLDLDGDRKTVPWLQTRFKEIDAQFSPDGRWIAYASNETGRYEVYVRPFRGTGEKRRVSSTGGRIPRWRGDGKEIFYVDFGVEPAIVSVSVDPSNVELLGTPQSLFQLRAHVRDYDVTKDGQRFLINSDADAGTRTLVNVVLNWPAGVNP